MTDPANHASQQSFAACPGCHQIRPRDTPRCPHCGLTLTGELAAHLRHIDDELHGIGAAMAYPTTSSQAYFGFTPTQLTERYRTLLAERGNVLQALYAGATDVSAAPVDTQPGQPAATETPVPVTQSSAPQPAAHNAGTPPAAAQTAQHPGPPIYFGPPTTPPLGYTSAAPLGYVEPQARPETSPKFVQNTLLALGGLLLAAAAITFTVLAWDSLGLAGRSVILGTATAILLVAPVLLARRQLRATAETIVVLGLLLVALDGYAAWRAVLAEQVDDYTGGADWFFNGFTYSALLAAIVAVIGLGYRLVSRSALRPLMAPPLVAVVVAHAIAPLLALGISTTVLSFAGACLAVAAADVALLAVAGGARRSAAMSGTGIAGPTQRARSMPDAAHTLGYAVWFICVAGATVASIAGVVTALAEVGVMETTTRGVAGACVVAGFAVVIVASGWFSRSETWNGLAAAIGVLLLGWDAALLVQRLSSEFSLVVVTGAGLGLVCATITVLLPQRLRTGATIGTSVVAGLTVVPVAVWALLAAWGPVGRTDSPWDDITDIGLRMLCALVLSCVTWALLQWHWRQREAGVEVTVGPSLLAIGVFTTTIGPLAAAPMELLVALPLFGAVMVTGMGLLDTGITREGTFAAGLLLTANALTRGAETTNGTIGTLIAVIVLYAFAASVTASAGVRVLSTTVASVAFLTLSAPITVVADGGEILGGYLVLLGAIALLVVASVIALIGTPRAQPASVAMEVLAGIAGFVALMLTLSSRLDAAIVATVVTATLAALALRSSRRTALWWAMGTAVVSVALWLRAAELETVESYTLPMALALLVIGVINQVRKPAQSSWVTFGPALLLGLTPTLILVLFGPPDALRALLLGLFAMAILAVGAFTDRQAPFVLGAVTVAAVAIRVGTPLLPELTAQLPVWVPLAVGGALLLAIGASYERGRRDVRRLVGAIRRME